MAIPFLPGTTVLCASEFVPTLAVRIEPTGIELRETFRLAGLQERLGSLPFVKPRRVRTGKGG